MFMPPRRHWTKMRSVFATTLQLLLRGLSKMQLWSKRYQQFLNPPIINLDQFLNTRRFKGSRGQQCDLVTGKCECRSSAFGGDKCDRCAENHFNFTIGCQPCEECYNLVQNGVEKIRERVNSLEESLERIVRDTMTEEARIKSRELEGNLKRIKNNVNDLHNQLYENSKIKPFKI